MDLDSGELLWSKQMTPNDTYNMSCNVPGRASCPEPAGPDLDIGTSASLVDLGEGQRALVFGQKSGEVHAIDPDNEGQILWQTRVSEGGVLGGIQWGHAVDEMQAYASLSDIKFKPGSTDFRSLVADTTAGGGLHAVNLKTGERVWAAPPAPCGDRDPCSPAQMSAVTAIPGVVFAGSMDGFLRAHSSKNGKVLWEFDAVRKFETVNGVQGQGGSFNAGGPAVAGGMVFVNSGYGLWGGVPGNVLLAFGVE